MSVACKFACKYLLIDAKKPTAWQLLIYPWIQEGKK
jgi:hypothetical protein